MRGWVVRALRVTAGACAIAGAAAKCNGPALDLGSNDPPPLAGSDADSGDHPFKLGDFIDKMETDGPSISGGYWYVYSDRTCAGTSARITNSPGSLNPPEGTQSLPINNGYGPVIDGGAVAFRELHGGGETGWGAGIGMDLDDQSPDNAYLRCYDACAAPPPDAGGAYASRVDASSHIGIQFYARLSPESVTTGNAPGTLNVDVGFADDVSHPAGGSCDPCIGSEQGGCGNDYIREVRLDTTWTPYTAFFQDTVAARPRGALDTQSLFAIHFQVSTAHTASPLPPFDLEVAWIRWVDAP